MTRRALVETGFLLALNPRDRSHGWALGLLRAAGRGELELCISPAAPLEASLILRSRGLGDDAVAEVLAAMEEAVSLYTEPRYCSLGLRHLAYAAELRARHRDLTFFDSIHAAVAVLEKLEYMDLDDVVKRVVRAEEGRRSRPSR